MLSVAEALAGITGSLSPLPAEEVALDAALDRVLAADLAARRTHPGSDVSQMDGYAVRAVDSEAVGSWLDLIGASRAGGEPPPAVRPGTAVRIFTGAPMPEGADAVAIQENAERDGEKVRFSRACRYDEFVRHAGLDFKEGWTGLPGGTLLDPRGIGLAAAMGHVRLPVHRQPRVAVLATGDELVSPGERAAPGQFPSSNSTTLLGLIRRWGGVPVDLGIARDTLADLHRALDAAAGCDLLLTTGGASVGEHDLVKDAIAARGDSLDFWKIAMRPGKPLMWGKVGATPLLGLPGNPVSATVCSILFLRAALAKLQGRELALPQQSMPLARALPANDERQDYLRARIVPTRDGLGVEPASRQDSSMFATMAHAEMLIIRAPHAPPAKAGELVSCVPIASALQPG